MAFGLTGKCNPLCRGFVLVGGNSTRMGRDKALLPFGDGPLAVWMAGVVQPVCGDVSLVGSVAKYSGLGCPVIPDFFPGRGPLAGIHAALVHSGAQFNLVVGCDMPYLLPEFLRWLLELARSSDADAVVPESDPFSYEPLCAIYTRACRSPIEQALRAGQRKLSRVLEQLRIRWVAPREWQPYDSVGKLFRNLNTPEEYQRAQGELLAGAGKPVSGETFA